MCRIEIIIGSCSFSHSIPHKYSKKTIAKQPGLMSYFHAWSTVDDKSSVAASEMDRENSYVSAGSIQHKNNSNAKENKKTAGARYFVFV